MTKLATLIYISGIIGALVLISGCTSTLAVLDELDYACVDVTLDGWTTDSAASGRGIRIPEGETLTPETVEALCP